MGRGRTGRAAPPALLPRDALVATGPLDQGSWNYRPLLGRVQRLRFAAATAALGGARVARVLEVGYGSGVFVPELARHAATVVGVDVHGAGAEVARALVANGVASARFVRAQAAALPFASGAFDAVVAISTLEFIDDIGTAIDECLRVLAPDGLLVAITPREGRLLDLGLRLLAGRRGEDDFEGRRAGVMPAIRSRAAQLTETPLRIGPWPSPALYTLVVARARGGPRGGRQARSSK